MGQNIEKPINQVVSLHSLVFSNTNDPSIGHGCLKDFENIKRELEFISVAANLKYEEQNKHFFIGNSFSITKIDSLIKSLRVGAMSTVGRYDVLVVYVSTHGFRRPDDTTDFPNVQIPHEKEFINSFDLHNYIKNNVYFNLQLTIIDACNDTVNVSPSRVNYVKQYIKKSNSSEGLDLRSDFSSIDIDLPIVVSQKDRNNYTQLFREVSGDFLITSSQPGRQSLTNSKQGSYFTNALIDAIHNSDKLLKNTNNWNTIFETAKKLTIQRISKTSMADPSTYIPVWNHKVSLIETVHEKYGQDLHAGKEKAENEKYALVVKKGINGDIECFINPLGEWGRGPHVMISQMDSVEYEVFIRQPNKNYQRRFFRSSQKGNKFKIQFSSSFHYLVKAKIFFNYGRICELNIMHDE